MILIANKPFIIYSFKMALNAGIKEIGVIVNETRTKIEAIFEDESCWNSKII